MKTEKHKRLSLSEFIKKYKKEHPKLKSQTATKKAKSEYKKYIKDIKQKKKDNKELSELKKPTETDCKDDKEYKDFEKKMLSEEEAEDPEE